MEFIQAIGEGRSKVPINEEYTSTPKFSTVLGIVHQGNGRIIGCIGFFQRIFHLINSNNSPFMGKAYDAK